MVDSILTSTKKALGLPEDYKVFDPDIIMHINSVLATLSQLGIGPEAGFMIEDEAAVWSDVLGTDLNLNSAKSYVYLKVRLLFDPPGTYFHITALQEQAKELEYRLNTHREGISWTDPAPVVLTDPTEPVW